MLCLWLAQFGAGRRTGHGARGDGRPAPNLAVRAMRRRTGMTQWEVMPVKTGTFAPVCLLIGRLTFAVFPDSYKTSPGARWLCSWGG